MDTSLSHFTEKDIEASKKLPGVFKTIFVTFNKNMFDKIKKSMLIEKKNLSTILHYRVLILFHSEILCLFCFLQGRKFKYLTIYFKIGKLQPLSLDREFKAMDHLQQRMIDL